MTACAMNVVTAKYAISMYPRATFIDCVNMVCDVTAQVEGGVEKKEEYQIMGWSVMRQARHANESQLQIGKLRWLGDERCWSIRHTFGPCEERGMHTWVARIAKGSQEVAIGFANAQRGDMRRWACVEGSLLVVMSWIADIQWLVNRYVCF